MKAKNKYTYDVTITYKSGNKDHEYNVKRKLINIPADSHEQAIAIAKEFYKDYSIRFVESSINDVDYIDELES